MCAQNMLITSVHLQAAAEVKKKGKGEKVVYLRFLRRTTAAAAITMITMTPMIMYVVVSRARVVDVVGVAVCSGV
jgi:hypothetical protein